jgi:nitrite reductase/ring-hydroxylating ferredoxin subunit
MIKMNDDLEGSSAGRWCVRRRVLFAGAGAAGAAALLTACSSRDDDPAPDDPPAAGGVLTTTSAVPVGGGTVVDGVVVAQPTEGAFKAYDARCPHQGALVSAPQDGVITCPLHNSKFAVADGAFISGLATRGLTEVAITVNGTEITRA